MPTQDPLLKTRQVAVALGMGVSTIKRWVDAEVLKASRTVGKHRLIRLSEAIRFARAQGLSLSGLEAIAERAGLAVGVVDEALVETLTDALRRGDARRGRGLIVSAHATGCGAAALADDLIRPVMERIGHGWSVGILDIYEEHQASQIVAATLIELNEKMSRSTQEGAPLAVGAASEGDPYSLPLLLGELVLREQGWEVRNLGPNLPMRSLSGAVLAYQPRLVLLSVNHLQDAEQFCRGYRAFYEHIAPVRAAVVIGGRALDANLRARLVYASFGERMAHLSELARRLVPDAPLRAAAVKPLKQPDAATS